MGLVLCTLLTVVGGAEWEVSTQTELFSKISNKDDSGSGTTGNSIMALGDTVTALSDTYSGSEIAATPTVVPCSTSKTFTGFSSARRRCNATWTEKGRGW